MVLSNIFTYILHLFRQIDCLASICMVLYTTDISLVNPHLKNSFWKVKLKICIISSVGKPIIAMLELFGRIRMMLGPLSIKVNNFCFVVKPESGQQCIFDYFWLNQWGTKGVGEKWTPNPRQIEQGWKLKMSNFLYVPVANAIMHK